MSVMSYIDAINLAMKEEMERDPRVFVLGEDVGRNGGVLQATAGLYAQFGEARVMDT
ncbi:UNVERIFIED_CONTAM: alpha-ketoacid dehydrogenase subunit beta, partial [Bacillus subtilis]